MARTGAKNGLKAAAATPAVTAPPSLVELQAAFQQAILTGDDSILKLIPPNSRTNAEVLFGVYRNAYVRRLVEVIGADHPLVLSYLGTDLFEDLARGYVAAHPSTTQNARWVSRHLASYTRTVPRFDDAPWVADLVALEAALNTAFDAADATPVSIAALQDVATNQWDRLVFSPHPSAARLNLATNAFDIWRALVDDAEEMPEGQMAATKLLVWRQDVTPMLRPLGDEEAMMWDEAAKGVRFGVLCEMLATYDDPETSALRAAQYLQGWLVTGALASARVEARRKSPRMKDLASR